jgi:hypothetical protein
MPRNGDKKPVGFATHITAGGLAGAMEAVSPNGHRSAFRVLTKDSALLPTARHHKGANAALQIRHGPWGMSRAAFCGGRQLIPARLSHEDFCKRVS